MLITPGVLYAYSSCACVAVQGYQNDILRPASEMKLIPSFWGGCILILDPTPKNGILIFYPTERFFGKTISARFTHGKLIHTQFFR